MLRKFRSEKTFVYRERRWQVELIELHDRSRSMLSPTYDQFIPNPPYYGGESDEDKARNDTEWAAWRRAELALLRPVIDWAVGLVNEVYLTSEGVMVGEITKATWSAKAGCSCGCSPGYILKGMPRGYLVNLIDLAHEEAEERKAQAAKKKKRDTQRKLESGEYLPCRCGGVITYSNGECSDCNEPQVFGA